MKNFKFLLLILLLQFSFVGCKDDSGICFLGITSLKLTNASYLTPADSSITSIDNYKYRVILEFPNPETKPKANGEQNTCVLSFDKLHTSVSDFSITSNVKLLNTAPGNPIDLKNFNIYQCRLLVSETYSEKDDAMNNRYSSKNWIQLLNTGSEDKNYLKPFRAFYLEFADKNKRIEAEGMTIKATITLKDGTRFTAETTPINLY